MNFIFDIIIFIVSFFLLTWLNSRLIKNLLKLARYFGVKEFIVAFFILGICVQLPNFFVDVGAALRGLPQIAMGDMIGGNLVDLTLVLALGALFSRKYISTKSDIVQGSAIFTFFIAIFPIILLLKGSVTRVDGLLLVLAYVLYVAWAFSKSNRFKQDSKTEVSLSAKSFVMMFIEIVAILGILFLVSQQIINYVTIFSERFGSSLSTISLLLVGLANCFPETYLTIASIRKGHHELVLGDLMASVIGAATLVFGVVALIHPFTITDVPQLLIGRLFLVAAAILFLLSVRSGNRITKKEGLILLFLYIAFLLTEIFIKF